MTQGQHPLHSIRTKIGARSLRNQRGSVMIMVAGSIIGLFTFAIVAIDGPILMTTKTQLQNAADAAALAGASQLRFRNLSLDERRDLARARAIAIAGANFAVRDSLEPVAIVEEDVTFPDPFRCRVDTYRTEEHGDALRTYFMKFVDPVSDNRADVRAYAIAAVYDICNTQCLKPWAIPDRWDDANGDGEYYAGEEFTDSNGNGVWDGGEPFVDSDGNAAYTPPEFYDPIATGYQAPGDVGMEITLHMGQNPNDPVVPGQYQSIALPPMHGPIPPLTGGAIYERWIRECAPFVVEPGDSLLLEPGAKVGPTVHGMEDLIALDPDAYWDPDTGTVQGSDWGFSPRIALVPFYDPYFPPESGRNHVVVSKIGAFFMESVHGNGDVTGRFIQVAAPGEPCENNGGNSFLFGVSLVE